MAGSRDPEDEIRELERQSRELSVDLEGLGRDEGAPLDLTASNPVQKKVVAPPPPPSPAAPETVSVRVVISEDQSMAHLFLYPPPGQSSPARVDEVLAAVKDKGVCYGLDGTAVAEAVETYNQGFKAVMQVLVAKGTPAQNGRDGVFTPKNSFVSASEFIQENPGYLLPAETIPTLYLKAPAGMVGWFEKETKGVTGTTVTGRKLPAQNGKTLFKFGPGFKLDGSGEKQAVMLLKAGALALNTGGLRILSEPRLSPGAGKAAGGPAPKDKKTPDEKPKAPVPPIYSFAEAENLMAVWMTLRPDEGPPAKAEIKDALARLRAQGVTHGIDQKAIREAVETYNAQPAAIENVLVAKGDYATDGADASLLEEIATESRERFSKNNPGVPMPEPQGEECYALVEAKTLIARVQAEAKGKSGTDVKGKKLLGKMGNNPFKAGPGITETRSGTTATLTAQISGLLVKRSGNYRVVELPPPAVPEEEKLATAEFSLDVSEDKLLATLHLRSPGGPCYPVEVAAVATWLRQRGLKTGVKANALSDLVARFNEDFSSSSAEIAYGNPPTPGNDAEVNPVVSFKEEDVFAAANPGLPMPTGPSGRLMALVKSGDVVVRVTPESRGKNGMGVDGSPIPALDGTSRFVAQMGLLPRRQGSVTEYLARIDGLVVRDGDVFALHEYSRAVMNIRVLDGGYQAVMEMAPGPGLWLKPAVPEVHEVVKKAGVVYGIHWNVIDREVAAFHARPGHRVFTVATGDKPENGVDGKITYHLELDLRPVMTPDPSGRIDYRFRRNFITVEEKQAIATISPPSPGVKPGVTVDGKNVLPEDGQPVTFAAGDGVLETPQGPDRYLVATVGGELVVDEKRREIRVVQSKVVDAVDLSLGHLTFTGNVTVKQNIEAGMKVNVKGDLLVKGMILGALVEVDGNVACEGGIITRENGFVVATREVRARFIENSVVKAGGSVKVERAILQSRVYSLETIEAVSAKSFVIGGVLVARVAVIIRHLGNTGGSRSLVHLGADFRDLESYLDLSGKIRELAAEAGRIDQEIARVLRPVGGRFEGLSPEGKTEYRTLLARKAEIVKDFRPRREECQKILSRIEAVGSAELCVLGYAFADNTVRFGSTRRITAGQLQNVRFTYDGEQRQVLVGQGARGAGSGAVKETQPSAG